MAHSSDLVRSFDSLLAISRGTLDEQKLSGTLLKFSYMCNKNGCDFQPTLAAIKRSEDLNTMTQDLVQKSVEIIDQHQGGLCANSLNGYLFTGSGTAVYIANETPNKTLTPCIGTLRYKSLYEMFRIHNKYESSQNHLLLTAGSCILATTSLLITLFRRK